jgi:hypothetical protein
VSGRAGSAPISGPIERLRAAVRESGSPLGTSLGVLDEDPACGEPSEHAIVAAAGPRVAANAEDVEIAVSAVDEGYRLHYGEPRALLIEEADLALLAGDRLYALGLARLAAIGDLAAIAELADVISLSAQGHATGDDELAEAAWQLGIAAIAHGPGPSAADAKAAARAGDPGAATALREAARAPSRLA